MIIIDKVKKIIKKKLDTWILYGKPINQSRQKLRVRIGGGHNSVNTS